MARLSPKETKKTRTLGSFLWGTYGIRPPLTIPWNRALLPSFHVSLISSCISFSPFRVVMQSWKWIAMTSGWGYSVYESDIFISFTTSIFDWKTHLIITITRKYPSWMPVHHRPFLYSTCCGRVFFFNTHPLGALPLLSYGEIFGSARGRQVVAAKE